MFDSRPAHLTFGFHRAALASVTGYSREIRPLRFSINVTLDGCCDHRAIPADAELHRHAAESFNQVDALLFGRVTYELMQAAWRLPALTPEGPDPMDPFVQAINAAKKYVVSNTLQQVDWNAELVQGDLSQAVQQLKQEPGALMICVQFIFKPGTYDDDFYRLDAQIDQYARSLPGFQKVETWQSAEGDIVNAVYYFADKESLKQLSAFPLHREAQDQVHRWYDGYRIVVSEITATYGDDRLPD